MEASDSTLLLLRPDTVPEKVDLQRYLFDTFFSADSIFQAEVNSAGYGVAGDPVLYTLRSDNMINIVLLFCFVVFVVSLSHIGGFIVHQLKSFFMMPTSTDDSMEETSGELRFQLFLGGLCCLLLSLSAYLYVTQNAAQSFLRVSEPAFIAIIFGALVVYFITKGVLYTIVNIVFFNSKTNLQWLKTTLFITSAGTVLLFPIVILQIYFDFSVRNVVVLLFFILLFTKILTFFIAWTIFFKRKGGLLQTFLYFCTLEIAPLLIFGGGLLFLVNVIRINF